MLAWPDVVLKRCTWHRRRFGYPRVFGVAFGRGRGVQLVEGICPRCAARIRKDLAGGPIPAELPLALPALVVGVGAVVIVLVAHSLDHPAPVREPLAVTPSETAVRPLPSVVPPPERIVYVPGWRRSAGAHPSSRPASGPAPRQGTPVRYDLREPLTGMGLQAP